MQLLWSRAGGPLLAVGEVGGEEKQAGGESGRMAAGDRCDLRWWPQRLQATTLEYGPCNTIPNCYSPRRAEERGASGPRYSAGGCLWEVGSGGNRRGFKGGQRRRGLLGASRPPVPPRRDPPRPAGPRTLAPQPPPARAPPLPGCQPRPADTVSGWPEPGDTGGASVSPASPSPPRAVRGSAGGTLASHGRAALGGAAAGARASRALPLRRCTRGTPDRAGQLPPG